MIRVTFVTSGKVVELEEPGNLLRASIRGQGGLPFKCGGGICGTCRSFIEAGREHCDAIKEREKKHLTEEELASGHRMACQTFVSGDVSVSWVPLKDRPPKPLPARPPLAPKPDA